MHSSPSDPAIFDAYLWSDRPADIEYAHDLCAAAGLDYETERARVTAARKASLAQFVAERLPQLAAQKRRRV